MMKSIAAFLLFFVCLSLYSQDWKLNIDEAKELASEKNLPIILVFQGSDWCAPCIKLDKEIWSTDEFKAYAKDHFVMLQADFPRKKANRLEETQEKHNKELAERYNQSGYFPHVVVLNASGEVLGRLGYEKVSPKEYIDTLNGFLE